MQLIQKIILIIIALLQGFIASANRADADDRFDWMNSNILSFSPPCIEVPHVSGMNQSSKSINVEEYEDVWVSTGVRVQEGKLLSMSWNTRSISLRPEKYRVLYRIDPRFSKPQVFIQKYDYVQKKYITDFNMYKSQVLPFYQQRPDIVSTQRIDDYDDYFNFSGRERIQVKKDDVINITLDGTGKFFGSEGDMQGGGLVSYINQSLGIITNSSGLRNKIIYASANRWCKDIITNSNILGIPIPTPDYINRCLLVPNHYLNIGDQIPLLTGSPSDSHFTSKIPSIPSCPGNADGFNNNPVCFYDKGRGFKVSVGGLTIKDHKQQFVYSPFTDKYFLYHYSDSAGDLDFTTQWPINGMYDDFMQTMIEWKPFAAGPNDWVNYQLLSAYLNSKALAPVNFLHFGVYTMEIEIGQANPVINVTDLNSITLDYFIADTESASPNSYSVSNTASQDFKANAYATGWLWLKVSGTSGLFGSMNINIANYTGSTWFSSVVYGELVSPLRDKFNELSRIIYEKLVSNPALQNIAKTCLVLYIIIYGLAFLAGSLQITATDIVVRVLKIGVIVALFSETSWSFFNDNLFKVFIEGSDYLLNSVIGITSNVGNIFGFVDPIFDRYSNGDFWALLFIQLLQITNGLAFFACLAIYSILIYLRAVLEVIISYCLAFLGLAVMISLAPFFIILMLFEQTKSMFDSWISTLFSYMIQPTILLVFFLLIDQLMAEYITGLVVRACWGTLIPLVISLDLSNLGIPISFSFSLPFLPGIPFYIPEVANISSIEDFFTAHGTFVRVATSGFIFFVYCKLSAGLIEYVTLVTQFLTNVLAARQNGRLQGTGNTVKDIMGDIEHLAKPVTSSVRRVGSFAKEKFSDQKITHRGDKKVDVDDPDYSKIRKENSGGAVGEGGIGGDPKDGGGGEITPKSLAKTPEMLSKLRSSSGVVDASKGVSSISSSKVSLKGDNDVQKRAESQNYSASGNSPSSLLSPSGKGATPKDGSVPLNSSVNTPSKVSSSVEDGSRESVQRSALSKEQVVSRPQSDAVSEVSKEKSNPSKPLSTPPKKDDEMLSKEPKKEFSTKGAGIGDRAKNLTPEQKKKLAEKFKPKRR